MILLQLYIAAFLILVVLAVLGLFIKAGESVVNYFQAV